MCLVTGGSSDIGRAASLQLAAEGGKVAILSRTESEGNATAAEITKAGGEAVFLKTDVGNPYDIQAAVDAVIKKWHRIDVVVNDAAMMTFRRWSKEGWSVNLSRLCLNINGY